MNLIIPMAGLGSRLYPLTKTKPKPLIPVAGKAIISHILDRILGSTLPIEKVAFITGTMEDQVQAYISSNYDIDCLFVNQDQFLGPADAVYRAKKVLEGEILIVFSDTIFELDFSVIEREKEADGLIWVYPVADPSSFGVVVEEAGLITQLVEKPDQFVSNLAQVGLYYFREGRILCQALEEMFERKLMRKNEYYLPAAFDLMIQQGRKLKAPRINGWYDCGTVPALLDTNQILLKQNGSCHTERTGVVIREPVHIAASAQLENSVIGPNVTIGENVSIRNSIVTSSILQEGAIVSNAILDNSLIGAKAQLRLNSSKSMVVGDYSQIIS